MHKTGGRAVDMQSEPNLCHESAVVGTLLKLAERSLCWPVWSCPRGQFLLQLPLDAPQVFLLTLGRSQPLRKQLWEREGGADGGAMDQPRGSIDSCMQARQTTASMVLGFFS